MATRDANTTLPSSDVTGGYVFLSYRSINRPHVEPIVAALRNRHVRLWWDQDIKGGVHYHALIKDKILAARALVVFVTQEVLNAEAGSYVIPELEFARESKIDLFPVRIGVTDKQLKGNLELNNLVGRIQAAELKLPVQSSSQDFKDLIKVIQDYAAHRGCVEQVLGSQSLEDCATAAMPRRSSAKMVCTIGLVVLCVLALCVYGTEPGELVSASWYGSREATSYSNGIRTGETQLPTTLPAQQSVPLPHVGPVTLLSHQVVAEEFVDVPSRYFEDLADAKRAWIWSAKPSLADQDQTKVIHWEADCEGMKNMKQANRANYNGSIAEVRKMVGSSSVRPCRFCYGIEVRRGLKGTEAIAPRGSSLAEPPRSLVTIPSSEDRVVEVPAGYLDGLGNENRTWLWSAKTLQFNAEMVLHWEAECEGLLRMKSSNRSTHTGSVAAVRRLAGTAAVRPCQFCYGIEFQRSVLMRASESKK